MKRFTPLCCFLLLVCFGHQVYSQFNPSRLDHYDELSGTLIYDIQPDQKGNIWIATLGGLVKYDGYDFTYFHPDPEDPTTIGDLLVYSLFEENDGTLWIGSQGMIYSYDPASKLFLSYNSAEALGYPENGQPLTMEICADGKGRVYFGVQSGVGINNLPGLLYYDPVEDKMNRLQPDSGQEPQNVFKLALLADGGINILAGNGAFIVDEGGDLLDLKIDNGESLGLGYDEYPIEMIGDDKGSIWFITNKSRLAQFDFKKKIFNYWSYADLYQEPVTSRNYGFVTFDQEKNLLISGEHGIVVFDLESKSFSKFSQDLIDDANVSNMTSVTFDSFGNLWIGTRSDGLLKFPNRSILGSHVHDPDDPSSISEGWISEIIESTDGSLFIPTYDMSGNEGLNRLDPETGKIDKFLFKNILPDHNRVFMIGEVNPDEILFRSNLGMKVYHTKTGEVIDSDFELVKDEINFANDVYKDADGDLWLCTVNGLFRKSGREIERIDLSKLEVSSDVSNEVTMVMESQFGGLWIQTNDGVFFIDDESNEIVRHGYNQAKGDVFTSQDINSLYEDSEGILWVGTWQGGLNRYDPKTGKVKVYDMDDGLPSMSIQGILGDEKNGALWLSTFSGMSRFNIEKEQFNNFSPDDGAQSLLYADGAFLETSKGLFVFGGSSGINIFDPDDISENSMPPRVEIIDFKVGSRSIELAMPFNESAVSISLTHMENNISVAYTGIHYDNPSKNKFSYRIREIDDDWRDVGLLRSAYYYNLSPGSYFFEVKAANSNGVWSDPESLRFDIAPPWWRTWWAYGLFAMILLSIAYLLYKAQKRRIVERERGLAREKELEQAKEIEKAYTELKATQAQLVQSEKMASLGELTAGIAHEIQNPLNFVNNFSDLSAELIQEANEELDKNEVKEVREILKNVRENLSKIHHHGGRASSIVKGMLDHSRTSHSEKELTDVNILCDEYMRLAFHGFKAKDKSFNVTYESNYDDKIPSIRIVPQDIGRVILNIINNAFQSVHAKQKTNTDGYAPKVTIHTSLINDLVEIRIMDNGAGIPEEIKDKIFQPFFTTKPTGQGTGLGLSLSYDIVKAHGGNLKVESEIGKGASFVIEIPAAL